MSKMFRAHFCLIVLTALTTQGFTEEKVSQSSEEIATGRFGEYYGRPYYYRPEDGFSPYYQRYYSFHPYERFHYYYGWE